MTRKFSRKTDEVDSTAKVGRAVDMQRFQAKVGKALFKTPRNTSTARLRRNMLNTRKNSTRIYESSVALHEEFQDLKGDIAALKLTLTDSWDAADHQ